MPWRFAILNNRLAEIYFDKDKQNRVKIQGHCYVAKNEYKTKQEQKWIEIDTRKTRVVYRNKKYRLVK